MVYLPTIPFKKISAMIEPLKKETLIANAYDSAEVDFNQLMPRYLVHKKLLENVYITSIRRISHTEYVCGAIIPQLQQQFLSATTKPTENILLLSEISRQGLLACAHQSGVSLDFALSGKVQESPLSPPLRTPAPALPRLSRRDCLQSSGSSLTSSPAWISYYVPACDIHYVNAEGYRYHLNLHSSQVLCDGFLLPHH